MKRLTWLLIVAVCTALAQVRPVDAPVKSAEDCCCCDQAGACGMPDCAPAPAAPQTGQNLPVAATQRSEARQPARAHRVFSFVRHDSRPMAARVSGVSPLGTPAARVPLFKAHCSFLI